MHFVQSNCKDRDYFYYDKVAKLVCLFMILCMYLKDILYIIAECEDFTDILTLPSSVSCSIGAFSSGCSNILCCTKMDFISRGIQTRVFLDPCDYKLTLSIETMNVTTSLLDYTWGRSETFSLQGGFKLKWVFNNDTFFLNRKYNLINYIYMYHTLLSNPLTHKDSQYIRLRWISVFYLHSLTEGGKTTAYFPYFRPLISKTIPLVRPDFKCTEVVKYY